MSPENQRLEDVFDISPFLGDEFVSFRGVYKLHQIHLTEISKPTTLFPNSSFEFSGILHVTH